MTHLLDVNVLVSLAWPNHVHHSAATRWFAGRGGQRWATTPVTEAGFVRVSCNPSAVGQAVTASEAIELLKQIRAVAGHSFLPDDLELVVGDELDTAHIVTHSQVTDAHLLALARRHDMVVATFDQAMHRLSNGKAVAVVPA